MGCSGDTATNSACGAYDQVILFFAYSPIFTGTNAKRNQTCGRQEISRRRITAPSPVSALWISCTTVNSAFIFNTESAQEGLTKMVNPL